jgi:hypothetical protein
MDSEAVARLEAAEANRGGCPRALDFFGPLLRGFKVTLEVDEVPVNTTTRPSSPPRPIRGRHPAIRRHCQTSLTTERFVIVRDFKATATSWEVERERERTRALLRDELEKGSLLLNVSVSECIDSDGGGTVALHYSRRREDGGVAVSG